MNKILIYGYGNPGRQDDGLGIFLVEKINNWIADQKISNVITDTNYQLNIEDAHKLNQYQTVFYVDASKENISNIKLEKIKPVDKPRFTMHSVSPEFVIGLCEQMYGSFPEAYVMHIKGYEWEFMKELTPKAAGNLEIAFNSLVQKILELL